MTFAFHSTDASAAITVFGRRAECPPPGILAVVVECFHNQKSSFQFALNILPLNRSVFQFLRRPLLRLTEFHPSVSVRHGRGMEFYCKYQMFFHGLASVKLRELVKRTQRTNIARNSNNVVPKTHRSIFYKKTHQLKNGRRQTINTLWDTGTANAKGWQLIKMQ